MNTKKNTSIISFDDDKSNTSRDSLSDKAIKREKSCYNDSHESNNDDINKPQNNSNMTSSGESIVRDGYATPKSIHNLNLLFAQTHQSNGKKKQINNIIENSPADKGVQALYIPISPIDTSKMNKYYTTYKNPQMIINNTDRSISINIKHIYENLPRKPITPNNRFIRKINFNKEKSSNSNSCSESSNDEIKKPQPINSKPVKKENEVYISPYTLSMYKMIKKPYFMTDEMKKRYDEEEKKKKNQCNCKRSKCLKLYCECFANGEYCIDCNCEDCSNIIGNESERNEIFSTIVYKNPVAIKLKKKEDENASTELISCNCTKSNCSKKYCECYKAGNKCNDNCRCRDCINTIQKPENENIIKFQPLQDLCVEKISILIHNKSIIINKSFFNIDDFINLRDNSAVVIKNINNSLYIEISKSDINMKNYSTPNLNKTKKRRRDSDLHNDISSEDDNFTKSYQTCDSTNKKLIVKRNISNNFKKKLIMDSHDAYKKN